MADPYIKLEHITKSFDSVYANKDISVDVYKGEILALRRCTSAHPVTL